MTDASRTLTLPVDDMAALIVRCAIQLASITVKQLTQDMMARPEGWMDAEKAEVVVHAEKGQQEEAENEA